MKNNVQVWLRLKITQRLLPSIILMITAFLFIASFGCSSSTTEPANSGQINMTKQYSSSDSPSSLSDMIIRRDFVSASGLIDSIHITRARFVLRDIKFKTQSDSSSFRATPFVMELNLSSAIQDMSVAGVPFGTYRKIEFDVHRINSSDVSVLPIIEQAQFQDFLVDERYSIIITGSTYTAGIATSFTFRSRVNVKQKIDLDPVIVISQPSPAINATMLVSSGGWFKSSGGVLLDPADSSNENTISDNLRASIKVFKDNNKDGYKDLD